MQRKQPKLYFRGTSRPEVFPFGEGSGLSNSSNGKGKVKGRVSPAVTSNLKRGVHSGGEAYVTEQKSVTAIDAHYYKGIGIRGNKMRAVAMNPRIRRLTPTECERLQGFPDGWTEGVSNTQRYKVLGNAVTVNVIKAIAEKLLKESPTHE